MLCAVGGVQLVFAQDINYSINDAVCKSENLIVENNSTDIESYQWDFCMNDLDSVPSLIGTLEGLSGSFTVDYTVLYDSGNWHGFLTDYLANKITRIDYDSDLKSLTTTNILTSVSSELSNPYQTRFSISDDLWVGFAINSGDDHLIRMVFGNGLDKFPTQITDLGNFSVLNNPYGLEIIKDEGKYFVITSNNGNNKLVILDFGTSLLNNPSSTDKIELLGSGEVNGASRISFQKIDNEWIGLICSRGDNAIFRMDMGSTFYDTDYTFTEIATVTFPEGVELRREGLNYYAWAVGRDVGFYKLSFGNNVKSSPTVDFYGKIGVTDQLKSFSVVRSSPGWFGFITSRNGGIVSTMEFVDQCTENLAPSNEFEPDYVNFSEAGSYAIELSGKSMEENKYSLLDTIEVLDAIAPEVDFYTQNQCTESTNIFVVENPSEDVISYSWDFNNDGVEDNDEPSPSYDFSGVGDYSVSLTVSSGTCSNTIKKDISIYSPPNASFYIPSGVLCTNTGIEFTNTSTFDPSADVSWSWDFDEDGIEDSNEENPSFIFTSAGQHSIRLEISIPTGCVDAATEIFSLQEGPEVAFHWTNNCFGEPVQFINNSTTGTGISYVWDFGDGTQSSDKNPTHEFSTAGEYKVKLIVDDGNCESVLVQPIEVSDGPIGGFSVNGDFVENLPLYFAGNDNSTAGDEIISWEWSFGDGLLGSGKDTVHTFNSPDNYTTSLEVTTSQGCTETIDTTFEIQEALEPSPDFNLPNQVCLHESVVINNMSINTDEYQWDFCMNDLDSVPSIKSSFVDSLAAFTVDYTVVRDSNRWYGFLTDFINNTITRIDYESDLESGVKMTLLESISPELSSPYQTRFFKFQNTWVAFIINSGNSHLLRVTFDDGLSEEPTEVDDLGTFNSLYNPFGLEIIEDEANYYLIISNNGSDILSIIDFGESLENNPSDSDVQNLLTGGEINSISRTSFKKVSDEWIGMICSRGDNAIYRIDMGSTLNDTEYTLTNIASVTFPEGIQIEKEGLNYYGWVAGRDLGLYRLRFGNDLKSIPEVDLIGTMGQSSQFKSFSLIRSSPDWYGFITSRNGGIVSTLKFQDRCEGQLSPSNEKVPTGIYYDLTGNYAIELTGTLENGNQVSVQDTLFVNNTTAPDINLTLNSQCISNPTSFTPITTSSITTSSIITSYSWDFDSDGIEDSDEENPMYQFPSAGTYTVRLDVQSDEGCGNFTTQEITIYEEPPLPSFTIAKDSFCIGEEVIPNNLTVDADWDDLIEYHWTITDMDEIVETTPGVSFSTSGQKIFTVYSSIPGCESEVVSDTIQVIGIPTTDFSFSNSCFGEEVAFTNESDIGSYVWDFGDGQSSMESDPTHLYDSPGTYQVDLTVTDNLGCDHTERKELVVAALPEPGFEYDLVCAGNEVDFQDVSVVDQADIVAWEWYADDELIAEDQAPTLTFEESGEKLVRLVVYSSRGCEATYMEYVDVLAVPVVDFGIEQGCIGETTTFTDLSADQGEVLSRTWEINGQQFDQPEVDYVFTEPGTYEVELMVMNNNFCLASTTKTVEVKQLPIPDFEVFGTCENEMIELVDNSVEYDDIIVSRTWELDGQEIGNGMSVVLPETDPGQHVLLLKVLTEGGCIVESDQSFDLKEKPRANFITSNDYGVPPFSLNVTNQTTNGTVHEWYINNELITTATNPELHFESAGEKEIKLISYSQEGCSDTISTMILSQIPEIDLKIMDMQLEEDESIGHVLLKVLNSSNLPIEALEVNIDLQNQFSISEQVYQRIEVGEEAAISLNTGIPLVNNNLAYLCITLSSAYGVGDASPLDNEKCINLEPRIVSEPPYPNPVESLTRLRVILPENGGASLSVFDVSGQIKIIDEYPNLEKGLNQFTIDMSPLDPGTYFIRFDYQKKSMVSRILKL